ncbi:MAG: hypothetical protein U0840_13185 [Gemmataceae bacterium]
MMMELNVTLDFACTLCQHAVIVTVQCSGKDLGLSGGQNLAAVNIPCPTCGQLNQLFFEPNGTVRSVRPYACIRVVPEPSVN